MSENELVWLPLLLLSRKGPRSPVSAEVVGMTRNGCVTIVCQSLP